MSKDTKPRKHRHKRHYTFMVISGDSDGSTKRLHLNHFKTQLLAYLFFLIVLAIICYIIYSAMTIKTLRGIQVQQKEVIDQLTSENGELEATQSTLETEIEQLKAAIQKRIEDEHISQEEAETLALPTGFPITGKASMAKAVDDATETTITEITEENKDEVSGNPLVVFTAAEGSSVIASGTGTVLTVTTDTKFGNAVTIDHGNGYVSVYRNEGDPLVTEGSEIDKGDIIFVIGEKNTSLGYQIQQDEKYIDPEEMIEING